MQEISCRADSNNLFPLEGALIQILILTTPSMIETAMRILKFLKWLLPLKRMKLLLMNLNKKVLKMLTCVEADKLLEGSM